MEDEKVMDLMEATVRLEAVAAALEDATARLAERQTALAAETQEHVGRIVGTIETGATVETAREAELERKLADAEARLAELAASAATTTSRKTLPAGMSTMLAKSGVVVDSMEAGALDGALATLSIEQRIAVKAELLRAGLLG
jgi:hypothetical protein